MSWFARCSQYITAGKASPVMLQGADRSDDMQWSERSGESPQRREEAGEAFLLNKMDISALLQRVKRYKPLPRTENHNLNWEDVCKDYRKFLVLKLLHHDTDALLFMPPEHVGFVWDSHIADTKAYKIAMDTIGIFFNHNPDCVEESDEYQTRYKTAVWAYENHFNCKPPATIWPQPRTTTTTTSLAASQNRDQSSPAARHGNKSGSGFVLSSNDRTEGPVMILIDTATKALAIQVSVREHLSDVKRRVQDVTGIPVSVQYFIYKNNLLHADQTLEEVDILIGSTFHLLTRLHKERLQPFSNKVEGLTKSFFDLKI
ncbi:uncharacterized protein EV422DRAFT_607735 [Fimicolochytrium jonesii]|uniref:uncharacterized protein n=1 Tax=Fimicolochytrium jonesii TaxID=1396493 RepID=UPI0022FF1A23|nr:uncharacterized protein EV422DRAFT_607735 [Fimicolochytrium jonesii]KAI8816589.1 hypothetical protein EV422DRAFT_607735 [Fimicolochytrium jonesii]